ncbi:MAG TPA: TIGR03790 family protein [Verrucomicrobiae bacterium]
MSFLRIILPLALLALTPFFARGGGEEVVVVYNSQMPESKMVAEHYAAMRQVPANQIFGFGLTTNEIITRADFTDFLQKPLADRLEAAGLWKFGEVTAPATNGQPAQTDIRVVASKIRYAVLCYGVPLKIAPSSLLEEFAAKITRDEFRRNEASVDSELTWLPVFKMKIPLTGPLPNPFYLCTNRATMNCTNGLLLVSRLDGPTPEIANGLVDKAIEAENTGLWGRAYFDARGLDATNAYYLGDVWTLAGADICRQLGFEVEVDTNEATLPASFPMSHIAIYCGWYAFDPCGPFLQSKMEFMPGAFAYHLNSYSAESVRTATQHWCGPLLGKGATCTMGCVYEPYLQFNPNIAFTLQALGNGYTFGEAAWASQLALSWQTAVIGDPLYQPFKKTPPELHALLARTKNPLIEWSFDRLICLDLARGVRASELLSFLANLPTTANSAVLNEKLGALYDASGKPSSAIESWQNALKLNPSPEQKIRLRLTLGEKLMAQNRDAEALENYRTLIAEAPHYPGRNVIDEKLKGLEQKIANSKKP